MVFLAISWVGYAGNDSQKTAPKLSSCGMKSCMDDSCVCGSPEACRTSPCDACVCNPRPKCVPCSPCPIKECIDECGGAYLTADFLWWRAENHGLSYAFNQKDNTILLGNLMHVNPAWDPGFRVGLGWNTTFDHWDFYADWTWYYNKSQDHHFRSDITPGPGVGLGFFPRYPIQHDDPSIQVDATWTLRYNVIDGEMGRGMFVTEKIGFRPYWGVRAAFIDQEFRDHFFNPSDTLGVILEGKLNAANKYWGVGPRVGAHTEWHLGKGFSFLGRASASALYGKTQAHLNHKELTSGSSSFVSDARFSDRFWQLVPNLQLLLGFQWDTCFWCDKMFYAVSVAWETNCWWNQCNIPVAFFDGFPIPTTGNQPVTLEGVTVNMEWDF